MSSKPSVCPERAHGGVGFLWKAALFPTLLCIFTLAPERASIGGNCKPGSPTADFVLTHLVRKAVVLFTPPDLLATPFSRELARSVLSQGELQQRTT
jgi:hypothetical protein